MQTKAALRSCSLTLQVRRLLARLVPPGPRARGIAPAPARGQEVLTLQQVGCEEGRRGVRAGQALLQEVSLKLQGKQVPRREFKTSQ